MKAGAANEDNVDLPGSSPASDGVRRDEVSSVQDFLRTLVRERDHEIEGLKAKVEELEARSIESEALKAQADQALSLTRHKLTRLLDQGIAAEVTSKAEAARLEQLETDLSNLTQTLVEAEEQARAGEAERTELQNRIELLERQLEDEAAHKADLERQAAEAGEWTFKLAADRRAAEMETAKAKRALAKQEKTRERLELETGGLRGQIRQLKDDIKASESRVDEVFCEIAEVSQLLRSSEDVMAEQRDALSWYVQVMHILLARTKGWVGLLPASVRRKRAFEKLAAQRLFDAEAYLNRYPDVRASGQDPLRHYISHGKAEGRFF